MHIFLALSLLAPAAPTGDATIRAKAGRGEIVVTTTTRVAGAIHSLTWNGKEFVDSFDHGRQIQSAVNLDGGKTFIPEVFNPTEAGSAADGVGRKSTSRLLALKAAGNELTTTTRMAFWLKPGEKSAGHPARNTVALSDHLVTKRVTIRHKNLPHAIGYDVTFTVPKGERHTFAQFEAVTGYMPPEFGVFLRFDKADGKLMPLTDGPGEQADPVVLSTADGGHAMGVYSPDQPSKGFEAAGYGRFRFAAEKVVKWNCVFRVREPSGVPAGEYAFKCVVVVGTRTDCEDALRALTNPKP
jgi:hypothetical protein